LGLGIALPFVAVVFIPVLRRLLPKPGGWMIRLQRILAVPMALSALAALWLLWRQGGTSTLLAGVIAGGLMALALFLAGRRQLKGKPALELWVVLTLIAAFLPLAGLGRGEVAVVSAAPAGSEPWSEERVTARLQQGRPVFVYFTADWCLTCKVNEAGAINRDSVQKAFDERGVQVLVGDWTNGDPAITRFLESRGRAGVPLYLWYAPGKLEPEELPQLLTPGMLIARASARS
jgi:thiol:disulfide interchange protein